MRFVGRKSQFANGSQHGATPSAGGQIAIPIDDWPTPALVLDRLGRVSLANRRAGELFGRDRSQLIGVAGSDLLGRDHLWCSTADQTLEFDVTAARDPSRNVALVAHASTSFDADGNSCSIATLSAGRLSRGASDLTGPPIVPWSDVAEEFSLIDTNIVCAVVGVLGLRAINDGFSRSTGDLVLSEVSRRLSVFAASSTRVQRISGSRFVVLMPPCEDPVRRLSAVVAAATRPITTPLGKAVISCAIGAVEGSTRSPLVLVGRADRALDAALVQGAGTTLWDCDRTQPVTATNARLAVPLLAGLTDGSIAAEFVPVGDAATGTVDEYRAHACWTDESGRRREEHEFMELAESLGIRADISWMLVHSAIELITALFPRTPARVSVRMQSRDLCRDDVLERIAQLQSVGSSRAGLLRLDVSGGVAPTHVARLQEALAALRAIGIVVGQGPTRRHGATQCVGRHGGGGPMLPRPKRVISRSGGRRPSPGAFS